MTIEKRLKYTEEDAKNIFNKISNNVYSTEDISTGLEYLGADETEITEILERYDEEKEYDAILKETFPITNSKEEPNYLWRYGIIGCPAFGTLIGAGVGIGVILTEALGGYKINLQEASEIALKAGLIGTGIAALLWFGLNSRSCLD